MKKIRDQPARPFVTSEADVRLNFRNINSKSASGPDDKTLKLCCDSLAPDLTELLQTPCSRRPAPDEEHAFIPKFWKMSAIVSDPTKRSSSQMNDYIPVAQTSIVLKCARKSSLST